MDETLTVKQAYAAMFTYLCTVYESSRSDFLGGMLGDMALLDDNKPADPAIWPEWLKAVQQAKEGTTDTGLGIR
jgi:hypothetical protein